MARRWEEKHDKPLTKEQLAEFQDTLGGKDHFALDREYSKAHDACKLSHSVPPASYIRKAVSSLRKQRKITQATRVFSILGG